MPLRSTREAIAFIRKHGIVRESGATPLPSLAAEIAGEPIRGNWWSHPESRRIFAITRAVRDHKDILVCRLDGGKITFVHRRVWPALVRVAGHFAKDRLAQLREVHTDDGKHELREIAFPRWVPREVRAAANDLAENEAFAQLNYRSPLSP